MSRTSQPHVCVCGICADTAILLNTFVPVEALGYKSLIRSGNVRIIRWEIGIRQRNQQLRYCYSDHIGSYTDCSPDYGEQLNIILASPTVVTAGEKTRAKLSFEIRRYFVVCWIAFQLSVGSEANSLLLFSHNHQSFQSVSFTLTQSGQHVVLFVCMLLPDVSLQQVRSPLACRWVSSQVLGGDDEAWQRLHPEFLPLRHIWMDCRSKEEK